MAPPVRWSATRRGVWSWLVACLAALGGCSPSISPSPTRDAKSAPIAAASVTFAAAAVDVAAELRSPSRVRWTATTLGPAKPTLAIVIANRGAAPLDVSDLHVHLEAVREGVSFRCAKEVGPPSSVREPQILAPGTTFAFERALDCALPLVGSYAVRVAVSFGRADWAAPREVRAFTIRVFSTPEVAPRNVDPIPGLWGAIGAGAVLFGDSGQGSGRIVVALVNGGRVPLELPRFRLALQVFRVGAPIPCEDEPTDLGAPAVLGAGASYREALEVSCLGLGAPGKYDVVARLQIGGGTDGRAVELGRLRVEITGDPARRLPLYTPARLSVAGVDRRRDDVIARRPATAAPRRGGAPRTPRW